jgi:hypothetical protein
MQDGLIALLEDLHRSVDNLIRPAVFTGSEHFLDEFCNWGDKAMFIEPSRA